MKTPDDPSPVEAAAIEWLLERSEGFTPDRARTCTAWQAADPRHAAAFVRLEQSLTLLEELPVAAGAPAAEIVEFPARRHTRVRAPGTSLAVGGLAAALVVGALVWTQLPDVRMDRRYATAAGAGKSVVLRDGSVLELNGSTVARVRFSQAERRVDLESGEAHFAVARDRARPFVVTAGPVSVRAVGTAFNVRHDSAAIEVVVVEGKVEIGPATPPASTPSPAPPPAFETVRTIPLVAAGERATVATGSAVAAPRIEVVDADAIRATLRWQPTVAEFADEPLRDVVARFNRRNRLQLTLDDAEIASRRIAGAFALDEAEAFARLLERDGDVVADRRGNHEIILRRRR